MPRFVNVPLKGAAQILHKRGLNMQGGYQGKGLGEKMKETEETGGAEGPECGQTPREGRTGAGWGCSWTCMQSQEGGAGCWGVRELKAALQASRVSWEGPTLITTLRSATGWGQPARAGLSANAARNFNSWQLGPWFLSLLLEVCAAHS